MDEPVEDMEAVPEGDRVPTAETEGDLEVVVVREVVTEAETVRVPVFVAE